MSKDAPPSRTAPQFVVRMPDEEFRTRIAESAKANNRSMNAEILARLEMSFGMPTEPYATQSQLEDFFKKMAREKDQTLLSVSLVRDMLGSYVINLFKRLPKGEQQDERVLLMLDLAKSAIDMNGEKIAKTVAALMQDTPSWPTDGDPTPFLDKLARDNVEASFGRRKILDASDDAPIESS